VNPTPDRSALSSDLLQSRGGRAAILALTALLFVAVRVALLLAREPFLDELYTVWVAQHPFGEILQHLRFDSGPPLYYMIARSTSVEALRWLSLAFAFAAWLLIVTRRELGPARFTAGLLLAAYPAAAYFATEGRGYALCALFVTAGVLAVDQRKELLGAAALVAAAYTHYYGVFFFPLLLLTRRRRGIAAFAVACTLFLPGVLLALHQPRAATLWNVYQPLFAPVWNLSFALQSNPGLLPPAPWPLVALAVVVLAVAVSRSFRFGPAVLIPVAFAIAFTLAGRIVYYPLRFESVVAGPLVLWAATSLERWRPELRRLLTATLVLIGLIFLVRGTLAHFWRPLDATTTVAVWSRTHVSPREPLVAVGLCYLPAVMYTHRDVIPFPAEQALHPGWWWIPSEPQVRGDMAHLPAEFVCIANRITPELRFLATRYRMQLLYSCGENVVVRATRT
jgi:hypothetical protein